MGKLKGYCQYCGYFNGDEVSTFVPVSDLNMEMYTGEFKGTGKKRVSARCTKCGGQEFLIVGDGSPGLAGRAVRGVARGTGKAAWGLIKGTAKAGGAAIGGAYKAGKWAYEQIQEDEEEFSGDPVAFDDGVGIEAGPPPIDDVLVDDLGSAPPDVPDDLIDDLASGANPTDEDPYGDRPEEHRIDWSHLKPPEDQPQNQIDDTPLDTDHNAEPMPHEGPLERPSSTPAPDYTAPPSREDLISSDTAWRKENYGKVSHEEWQRHEEEHRRQMYERKKLDLQKAGGRIEYGSGSYEELLPDGTIRSSEVQSHGAGSSSSYNVWERPDGSSTTEAAASETGPGGSHESSTSIEFDGDGTHEVHTEATDRQGPPQLPDGWEEGFS